MKRSASVLAATLVMASLLSSCSEKDGGKDKEVKEGLTVTVKSVWDCSSLGLIDFMSKESDAIMAGDKSGNHFGFTQAYGSNIVADGLVNGDYDMAVLPLDEALGAYRRSNSTVQIVDIGSLTELYVVTNDASINSLEDIKDKDVLVPDYVQDLFADLAYQKDVNVNIVKAELEKCRSDVEASADPVVCVLPEPYATELVTHSEKVHQVCSVNEEWEKENGGTLAVDTVTVARKSLINEHPDVIKDYLEKHKASVDALKANPENLLNTVAAKDIVRDRKTAEKKLKENRSVFISGSEMKEKVLDYLDSIDYDDMDEINTDDLFYIPSN